MRARVPRVTLTSQLLNSATRVIEQLRRCKQCTVWCNAGDTFSTVVVVVVACASSVFPVETLVAFPKGKPASLESCYPVCCLFLTLIEFLPTLFFSPCAVRL